MTDSRIARFAGILMLATVLSRFLGYVWKALLSAFYFGSASDAFLRANTLPNMLYNILIGVLLSALFIPFFTRYLVKGERDQLWRLASALFNILFLILLVISFLGVVFAPTLTSWLNPNSSPEDQILTTQLSQIMFPALVFLGWAGLLTALLNSFQRFTLPALAVVAFNSALILFIYLFRDLGIQAAALGWSIAAGAQFLAQMPGLWGVRFRYDWRIFSHPDLKRMAILALPLLLSATIDQLSPFFEARLTSYLVEGSFTALRNAGVIVQLPLGIFAMSVTTAIYPTLTGQISQKSFTLAKESIRWAITATALFIIPSTIALITLATPITRVLFQYGEVTTAGTGLASIALALYAPGLFANSTLMILFRAFYAMQDTLTPVLVTMAGLALQIGLYFLLIGPLGLGGLALASSLSAFFNLILMTWFLRRKVGPIGIHAIGRSLGKMVAAAAIMGIVCWLLDGLLLRVLDVQRVTGRLLEVGALIITGAFLYGLLLYLFKVKEIVPFLERAKLRLAALRRRN
ncbi:MAG: murein biosynthesis integral membrane protein MurJ [bacterium]